MGGRNSIEFAARYPEKVQKLIIVDIGPVSDRRGIDRIKREIIGVPEEFDTIEAVLKHASPQNPRPPDNVLRRRLTYQTRLLPNGKIGWRYDRSIREGRRRGTVPPSGGLWPPLKKITCPTLLSFAEPKQTCSLRKWPSR